MNRRSFLAVAAAGAAGLAGCGSLPTLSRNGPLSFGSGVDEATRTRCRAVLERVSSLVGVDPAAPVRVRYVDPESEEGYRLGLPYGQFAFATPGDRLSVPRETASVPGALGRYDAENRRLTLADPDGVPDALFENVDGVPAVSLANYPSDPFLAHELTHALQHDAVSIPDLPDEHDRRQAHLAVREGAAEYVSRRYHRTCVEGEYSPCTPRAAVPATVDVPLWLVPGRLPYVNGMALAQATVASGGWERLWDLTGDPPTSAAVAMFPDDYFGAAPDWKTPPPGDGPGDAWRRFQSGRAGVHPLYVYLRALGVFGATAPGSAAPRALADETGAERLYRADRLRAWRGDWLSLFTNDDRRVAHRWTIAWASPEAARDVATAARRSYDENATPRDGVWQVGRQFVALSRRDATVTVSMAPSRSDLRALHDSG